MTPKITSVFHETNATHPISCVPQIRSTKMGFPFQPNFGHFLRYLVELEVVMPEAKRNLRAGECWGPIV